MTLYDATILSPEGSRELLEELANPPADTPERRATFERMREMEGVRRRSHGPGAPPVKKP